MDSGGADLPENQSGSDPGDPERSRKRATTTTTTTARSKANISCVASGISEIEEKGQRDRLYWKDSKITTRD
jgi:hypothetical protein